MLEKMGKKNTIKMLKSTDLYMGITEIKKGY